MNFTPNIKSKEELDGKLAKFEPVKNYMVELKNLVTFRPEQNIFDVIEIIIEKRISGGPVLDEAGQLVGIISEKDCLRIIVDQGYHNQPHVSPKVEDYMTKKVKTLPHDADVVRAAAEFIASPVRRLPVVRDGVLLGQVSRRDILRAAKKISLSTWG